MALINCPECGKEISDQAPKCIHCGFVLNQAAPVVKEKPSFSKYKKPLIVIAAVLVVIAVGVVVYLTNFTVSAKYDKATRAFDRGNYEKAVRLYGEVGDYKNAPTRLIEATTLYNYTSGKAALEAEEWESAKEYFTNCIDYEDSKQLANEADYKNAMALMEEGRYEEAKNLLTNIKGYEDAQVKSYECDYNIGLALQESGDYLNAAKQFRAASDYQDSNERIISMGEELVEKEDYHSATNVFNEYPNESDIAKNPSARYAEGKRCLSKNNYHDAAVAFQAAGDFLDSKELFTSSAYTYATERFKDEDYGTANVWFGKTPGYEDSDELKDACELMQIHGLLEKGNLHEAKEAVDKLDENLTYGDRSAAQYKELLDNNAKWVDLCGKWTSTGGQMRSTQSGSYYNYWWYRDFDEGDENLEVRCILDEDGNKRIQITGTIDVYTSYSSIEELLELGKVDIKIDQEISGFGTIKVNDLTSITISDSKITVNYKKTDRSRDVYFDYIYKTDVTYGKRVSDY